METPLYSTGLSLKRILIPKSLTLIFLGSFFYIGIFLNLSLLNIQIPAEWHLYIILGIAVLVVLQGILNYMTFSSFRYHFYYDKIIFIGKKEVIISYSQIQGISVSQDQFDSFFNTGSIFLSPVHKMMAIENTNQIYFYMQKLLDSYKQNYAYYQQRQQYLQQQSQNINPYATGQQNNYYQQQVR